MIGVVVVVVVGGGSCIFLLDLAPNFMALPTPWYYGVRFDWQQ